MSGLQKKAMLRNAWSVGLEAVSETTPSSLLLSVQNELHQKVEKRERKMDASNEILFEKSIASMRESVFPVQETYTNSVDGLTFNTYYSPPKGNDAPMFVCHHGAGSSAMTFWCLAKALRDYGDAEESPGVFVFDARGHGDRSPDPEQYLLLDFAADFRFVLCEFIARNLPQNSLCLVGHSLGGAVITEFISKFPETDFNIKGLVVIDIVEETAVRSLDVIDMFLSKRPKSFTSYSQAISWHLQSRLLRNEESAKVSVPDLLHLAPTETLTWKANLSGMAQSWGTWFSGLSRKFLECNLSKSKLSKLLILSSNETLDKHLTIGQMQGKFQLIVFNNSTNAGHFLHEDIPHQISASLIDFMRRFNSSSMQNQQKSIASLWGGKISS